MSGESMIAIADYFEVSRQTAYNYHNKAKNERLAELENKTYLDIFVDRLHELEAQRDVYRKLVERIQSGHDLGEEELDPRTGEVKVKTSHLRNISEIGKLIRDYDKLILDLEYAVGLIPKNNPDSIYGKVSDRNPESHQDEKSLIDLNDDELSQKLLDTLTKKMYQVGDNTLKNIKDEKVL
jgi:predicted DNA-binding protein YlxM (UPF0122 family)